MTTKTVSIPKTRRGHPQTNPNSLANLIPYKPGTNGHGRVYPLKLRLQHALDHPLVAPKDDAPAGDHIVYATLKGAKDLVPVAFRETWDRVEGKVLGDQPQGNPDNRSVTFVFVLPNGNKVTPKSLVKGMNGCNSSTPA